MIRGVIEGFYGPPWSHAERLDLIRFCGEEGLTTWVHAPKDDPHHRARWRDPYPADEVERLSELIAETHTAGVAFAYAIAPGLSIDYDDEHDFELLLAKCEQVRAIGADSIQLLWDDIESRDGEGQARVSNRLADALPQERLVICPVGYAGTEDTPYRRSLSGALDAGVVVYWTGPEVVSHAIAREELDVAIARFGGRELLLWDNYPVNDFAPELLFLGPLRGRDPRLFEGRCAGLIANAMLQAVPSKLPLATVADFLRDPHGYDPAASFARARERYGAEVLAALGEPADVAPPDDLFAALALGVDAPTAAALLR
ncbi:MAG TPA: protein O-GlcNAcase [Gaiellaceae bacterium]|nr:protein O-GlcNAcase [Gaiellaceae bacterium]